jgi:hypothetical protein
MYDFKSLSAYDFEVLVRDLLQKHFRVFLESFKSGRDKGIDLRHAPAQDDSLIVQCKHYLGTGYSGLIRTLKKEVPKVKRLAPARYCIATSVDLSPGNKEEIHTLFQPFCQRPQDIFGMQDLNNLLGQFPKIERQHFKLWLTSTTILEKILHSALYNQTSTLVEEIQDRAKRYVQNESFFAAQEILKEYNYCIISGIPGIGKTFLAEILLLQHISSGYEPVVVRSHIREAFEMLKASTKQVFYYDDFLGQTGWEERLEKNEEQSILDFVSYVKTHKHARFLLTTREYILQQARNVYEKLHASDFDHAKCIIKLESYTRRDRAHILFNHIYFSSLPQEHKRTLLHKNTLLTIVDHDNYSPRIVEWMSDHKNIRDYPAIEYPKHFLNTLANPSELWRHAFRNHLSPAARSVLIVMMTFQAAVELEDFKDAFNAFRLQEINLFGGSTTPSELLIALDELEGSFIRCDRDQDDIIISFHNPSVRDFLEKYLAENAEFLRVLCSSIVFYDQFLALWALHYGKDEDEIISNSLGRDAHLLAEAIVRSVSRTAKQKQPRKMRDGSFIFMSQVQTSIEKNVAHALTVASKLPDERRTYVARTILDNEIIRIVYGSAALDDVSKVISISATLDGVDASRTALIEAVAREFEDEARGYDELGDIVSLQDFIKAAPQAISKSLIGRIQAKLDEEADMVFDGDISDADGEHDIDRLRGIASEIERTFHVDLSFIQLRLDAKEDQIREQLDEPSDDWYEGGKNTYRDASDAEIVAMFGSLLE